MEAAVMIAGALAVTTAWRLIASGRATVWVAMSPVLVAAGSAAVWLRPPVWASDVDGAMAAASGLAVGVLLFLATRLFVAAAGRWATFQRHAAATYRQADDVSFALALALSAIMVVGEELFWRGLFQARLAGEAGAVPGAVLTTLAYVAANLPSGSLAIAAGALVGGAVWAGLAVWSGGILASLACHLVWATLMLARPPRRRDLIA